MRKLLVVLDGAADLPDARLGGKTPLQAAETPFLDAIPKKAGMLSIAGHIAPESDAGVFAVLGFNPFKYKPGRGCLEALGAGVELNENTLAIRANLATVENGVITDRRAGRIPTGEAQALEKEINEGVDVGVKFVFKATAFHRGVVVLEAEGLSKEISNTDPAYSKGGDLSNANATFSNNVVFCNAIKPEAGKTAALVNEFVRQSSAVLNKSEVNKKRERRGLPKANYVLLRGADFKPLQPPKMMAGWTIIADMPLELGIAKLLGMKVKKMKNTCNTANGFVEAAEKANATNTNAYVHIKGPDLPAHDGLIEEKKKCIEEIDAHFFSKVKFERMAVTCDHATPCARKAHSNDPVPYAITGEGSDRFAENQGRPVPASRLMEMLEK